MNFDIDNITAPIPGAIASLCAAAEEAARILYDRKSAAQQLSISTRTLDTLIANKHITVRRIGSRVLIPYAELKRFARADHFDIGPAN